jgi:hypothetical protein
MLFIIIQKLALIKLMTIIINNDDNIKNYTTTLFIIQHKHGKHTANNKFTMLSKSKQNSAERTT